MTSQPKKPLHKKITPIFKKAALAVAFCLMAGYSNGPPAAPLTEAEVNLTHSVFSNRIDTSAVWKKFRPSGENPGSNAATNYDGRSIFLYGVKNYSPDYSLTDNPDKQRTFMHEMTHIWQDQTIAELMQKKCKIYSYSLTKESDFDKFCVEQQATIIGDYAQRFLHPAHKVTLWYITADCQKSKDTPEEDALLQKVVEDKFPEARKTRLAREAQQKTDKIADARLMGKLRLSKLL